MVLAPKKRIPPPGRLARLWPRVRPYRGTLLLAAGQWGLFTRQRVQHPDQRELFTRTFGSNRELVLATGDLGNAVLLDADDEALVGCWNSDQETVFKIFGLDRSGDNRLTLTTSPGTNLVALWNHP